MKKFLFLFALSVGSVFASSKEFKYNGSFSKLLRLHIEEKIVQREEKGRPLADPNAFRAKQQKHYTTFFKTYADSSKAVPFAPGVDKKIKGTVRLYVQTLLATQEISPEDIKAVVEEQVGVAKFLKARSLKPSKTLLKKDSPSSVKRTVDDLRAVQEYRKAQMLFELWHGDTDSEEEFSLHTADMQVDARDDERQSSSEGEKSPAASSDQSESSSDESESSHEGSSVDETYGSDDASSSEEDDILDSSEETMAFKDTVLGKRQRLRN